MDVTILGMVAVLIHELLVPGVKHGMENLSLNPKKKNIPNQQFQKCPINVSVKWFVLQPECFRGPSVKRYWLKEVAHVVAFHVNSISSTKTETKAQYRKAIGSVEVHEGNLLLSVISMNEE